MGAEQTFSMREISNALSFSQWSAMNLTIINMQGKYQFLDLNIAQKIVHSKLELQRKAGLPMRVIILKARREGVSTYVEGRFFHEINRFPLRFACVCSADIAATQKVFGMAKLFQEKMPDDIRLDTVYSSRNEIVYAGDHKSSFLLQTAGKDVLGRGGLTHYLHCTEFAFWQKAKEQFAGAAQEIPDDPDTIIALESTANGVGGAFYDMYDQAVGDWRLTKDLNNYIPIFLPWFIFPAYSKPVLSGFKLDAEEKAIQTEFSLSTEQMYWRRWAIKNKCQGDISLFRQEYPSTYLEAFQASGNPVFTNFMISFQSAHATKEPRYCIFTKRGIEDVDRKFNCWQIRTLPRVDHQYCIGIDTMEGRVSDVQDVKSKLDCDGITIMDRTTGEFVAIYHGRGNQDDLADQCLLATERYNEPWIAPEIPNSMVLLKRLKEIGYQNIYNRQVHDEQLESKDSENLGWRTTMITRKFLVDDFITAMRNQDLKVGFGSMVEEMRTFIKDKSGKPIHQPGKHDDLLFSGMIALQVHLRCPLNPQPYPDSHTSGYVDKGEKENKLCFSGAIDTGLEDEDDDYFESHTV